MAPQSGDEPIPRIPTLSLYRILRRPLESFTNIAREQGDIAQFRFGDRTVYLLSHPDFIREVLVERHQDYVKSRSHNVIRRLTGEGLLVTEGEFHKNQRKVIQPSFNHPRIASYVEPMSQIAESEVSSWEDGAEINVSGEFRRLAMAMVVKVLFGADIRPSGDALGRAFATSLTHTVSQYYMRLLYYDQDRNPLADIFDGLPTPGNRNYREASRLIEQTISKIISDRRIDLASHDDLLDVLVKSRDYLNDGPLSERQIRDEAMTFFLAGLDTTSTALAWSVFLLASNPKQERKLHEEVDAVLGGRAPKAEDIKRLPYTQEVLLEAMRLYPPVWLVGRQAVRDTKVGAHRIRSGETVILSQWVLHHDPRFFEEPESFMPERWTDEMKERLPKFAFFPFGVGARGCIGEPLAKAMGAVILGAVASKWRLKLVAGASVVPHPRIILQPKNGIRVSLESRA
ncbi:MAG: cytochrome P450 [Thaumarchaeota archaeon]|nr:cytochrome P450 [Nitrososphaerota archaeon]